ncbi:MAG: hypothetical protein AAGM38_14330 [Pseudomonadota bacterium]
MTAKTIIIACLAWIGFGLLAPAQAERFAPSSLIAEGEDWAAYGWRTRAFRCDHRFIAVAWDRAPDEELRYGPAYIRFVDETLLPAVLRRCPLIQEIKFMNFAADYVIGEASQVRTAAEVNAEIGASLTGFWDTPLWSLTVRPQQPPQRRYAYERYIEAGPWRDEAVTGDVWSISQLSATSVANEERAASFVNCPDTQLGFSPERDPELVAKRLAFVGVEAPPMFRDTRVFNILFCQFNFFERRKPVAGSSLLEILGLERSETGKLLIDRSDYSAIVASVIVATTRVCKASVHGGASQIRLSRWRTDRISGEETDPLIEDIWVPDLLAGAFEEGMAAAQGRWLFSNAVVDGATTEDIGALMRRTGCDGAPVSQLIRNLVLFRAALDRLPEQP